MTRDETKQIIRVMAMAYPNYKPGDLAATIDLWHMMLEEYSYSEISLALKTFITTDTSGFAPSVGQLISALQTVAAPRYETANEAWDKVRKAICNSAYNSEEEFEHLPPIVQKAVGSAGNLRALAVSDIDTIESVEKSHFIRIYNAEVERAMKEQRMPQEAKSMVQKLNGHTESKLFLTKEQEDDI